MADLWRLFYLRPGVKVASLRRVSVEVDQSEAGDVFPSVEGWIWGGIFGSIKQDEKDAWKHPNVL